MVRHQPFVSRFTCFDLHQAAARATEMGLHDLAARLFHEAARCAFTTTGAHVLLEKAAQAEQMADMAPRYLA